MLSCQCHVILPRHSSPVRRRNTKDGAKDQRVRFRRVNSPGRVREDLRLHPSVVRQGVWCTRPLDPLLRRRFLFEPSRCLLCVRRVHLMRYTGRAASSRCKTTVASMWRRLLPSTKTMASPTWRYGSFQSPSLSAPSALVTPSSYGPRHITQTRGIDQWPHMQVWQSFAPLHSLEADVQMKQGLVHISRSLLVSFRSREEAHRALRDIPVVCMRSAMMRPRLVR